MDTLHNSPARRAALRALSVVPVAAGAVALSLALAGCDPSEIGKAGGLPSARFNSLDVSGAKYAQDFELADMHGQVRHMADFRGKVVAMFFGYTQCPDVCPTTLGEMVLVRRLLGADADRLQVLFVTVDPARDTAPMLKEYMAAFDPSFLALIPTPQQLKARIAPDFKVYYNKVEGKTPTSYTMDHTAGVLIFDPEGKVRLHSNYGAKAEAIAQDVQKLLQEKP